MKIGRSSTKGEAFEPIEMIITLQSQQDVNYFYHLSLIELSTLIRESSGSKLPAEFTNGIDVQLYDFIKELAR